MSENTFYCSLDFAKFRSVLRHCSGDEYRYYLAGVQVEIPAEGDGLVMMASSGSTMAMNYDENAQIGVDFPEEGLQIIPKFSWYNKRVGGTVWVFSNSIRLQLERGGNKLESVDSAEHLRIGGYEYPILRRTLSDINFENYNHGTTSDAVHIDNELLALFCDPRNRFWRKGDKLHDSYSFVNLWISSVDSPKNAVIITNGDPDFVGLIMPRAPEDRCTNLKDRVLKIRDRIKVR